jgi:hypothetical protein
MGAALLLMLLSASPEHMRLSTSRGPVHVLIQPRAQLTVVYVHGYYTHVDDAWVHHRLGEQLLSTGLAATFIVPEAPAGPDEDVAWPELEELLGEVERATNVTLPRDVVAAGHSGGYRTLAPWTGSARVHTFVLLDALYGSPDVWSRWLDASDNRRLVVLSRGTAARAATLCRGRERAHCRRSAQSHMEIITGGRELPALLREAAVLPSA